MTKREYLISLGLAKPTRGKFSSAGLDALAKAREQGMTFTDDDKAPVTHRESKAVSVDRSRMEDGRPTTEPGGNWTPQPPQLRIRDIAELFYEDDRGITRQFMTCRKCAYNVAYCACKTVGLPTGAVRLLDTRQPMLVK